MAQVGEGENMRLNREVQEDFFHYPPFLNDLMFVVISSPVITSDLAYWNLSLSLTMFNKLNKV